MKHTYDRVDTYRVTIYGTCDNLYGYYPDYKNQTKALRTTLFGILVPKNSTSPLKYAWGSFFGCENLRYFGKGVLDNLAEDAYTLEHLFDGAPLNYIYPNIFYGCKNVKYMGWLFEATMIKFIYANTFRWTPNVIDMQHIFHRCICLEEIPEGFFDYTTKCKSFHTAFKSCSSLKKVPANLFDKCTDLLDVSRCFCGGKVAGDTLYDKNMYITTIPHIWKHPNIENIINYINPNTNRNGVFEYVRGCKMAGYPVYRHITEDGEEEEYMCTH